MNFKENVRIALAGIKSNKMRSFLTMLGIIIGVASVIAIVTIGNSGKAYLVDKINEAGGQTLNIMVDSTNEDSRYNITGLDDSDIETIKDVDLVQYVSPVLSDMGSMQSELVRENGIVSVTASNADYANMMKMNVIYGRFFSDDEYKASTKVCVITDTTAENFFHTANPVGETLDITLNDKLITFKIVGVVKSENSTLFSTDDMQSMMESYGFSMDFGSVGFAYVPSSVLMEVYGNEAYRSVSVTTYDVSDLDRAGELAIGLLNARHNITDNSVYKARNMATLVNLLDTVIEIFTIFISSVGAISLLVGGIGVMNIMLVSVTERTREIGIRKALGARTKVILFQFLTESVVICLIGGLIGMGLGFAVSYAVSSLMGAPVSFSISTILIAVGFSTAVGVFFGIYPARKAAKMPPIEALRQNG